VTSEDIRSVSEALAEAKLHLSRALETARKYEDRRGAVSDWFDFSMVLGAIVAASNTTHRAMGLLNYLQPREESDE